jgi:hypothetical protein
MLAVAIGAASGIRPSDATAPALLERDYCHYYILALDFYLTRF